MDFQIGDKLIHSTYGLGEVVLIEEKNIHGRATNCYVFRTHDLTIWIPIDDLHQNSLRKPTMPNEFTNLFSILTSPGEPLPEDRILRKDQLTEYLKNGQIKSICQVVRDLTHFKRRKKLNDQEKFILERATDSLLTEWIYALGVSRNQAEHAMLKLLEG